jgi:transcriptional regulator with XRE-family HTH domain
MEKTQIHIGNLMRESLRINRISQVEAAEKMGISPQGLNTILKKSNVNTEYLIRFYEVFKINLFDLVSEQLTPNKKQIDNKINLVISLDEARSKDILSILTRES